MAEAETIELAIGGMDCPECALHVQQAIARVPGVEAVQVFLATEKAVVRLDTGAAGVEAIRLAVAGAGYRVAPSEAFTGRILAITGIVFGLVLFVVVVGEWLGLIATVTARVPLPLGAALVLLAGFPVFRNVVRAALRRQVISHTLMTVGVVAALAVGQWATAAVVVLFMRVGDYVEQFTTGRARRAVKDLAALAPQQALVERDGRETPVPAAEVRAGEIVVVRPGEQIPVDGEVIAGAATVDQAAITGEAMPLEAGPGAQVYAASFARLGSLRVRATGVGSDTVFGRTVRMVEEAEGNRGQVQRLADRFSALYLPVVAGIAALTLLLRRDPLATAAVLLVACSCSLALATPIAMLASIGAAARRGVLIKGGKHLEALAAADVLLVDKTGTLTLGRPAIVEVLPLDGATADDLLAMAATVERYSEHPLAGAVRFAAQERGLSLGAAQEFVALPGLGVRALVDGTEVTVGSRGLVAAAQWPAAADGGVARLEQQGRTLLFVAHSARVVGILAAADTLRPEVPGALAELRRLGIRKIELLTGDTEPATAALAAQLGVEYRASLLPEDKIGVVRSYQQAGHRVIMVGDGVNDAPALAQADVGIAMGAAGSAIAAEAAHLALLRDDWGLVPQALAIARRTMSVVKANIAFTAVYNVIGLSLAAAGLLPPVLAAAAQSLPDLGILANSARLLRQPR